MGNGIIVQNDPVNFIDPSGKLLLGASIGFGIGFVQGAMGAMLQGGTLGQILTSAALGGLSGLAVGLLDPTEGIGTIALSSGLLGAGVDLLGQEIAVHNEPCDNGYINWGSVIGSGVGSAIGGAMGGQMASMALQSGGSEALSNLLGSMGMAPSVFGSGFGASIGASH